MRNILLIICTVFIFGCGQQPKATQYTEIIIEKPLEMDEPVGSALVWDMPQGWEQGLASSMRLASFHLVNEPGAIDVSIVSLPGGAGGLEANLKRWIGQIGLDVSEEQLTAFMTASKDKIFDFSKLQANADPLTKSMIVAMLDINQSTVFVKMTGTADSIGKHKNEFLNLLGSVRSK